MLARRAKPDSFTAYVASRNILMPNRMETATLSTFVAESLRSIDGTGTQGSSAARQEPSLTSRTRRHPVPDARTRHGLVPCVLGGTAEPAALPRRTPSRRRPPEPARRGTHHNCAARARVAVQAGPLFTRTPRSGHIRTHHRRHHGAPDVANLLLVRHVRPLRQCSLHRRVRRLRHRPDHRRHRDLLVPPSGRQSSPPASSSAAWAS